MQIEERIVAQLLEDIRSNRLVLPTLPEVALQIRDAVEDDNASAAHVAKIVATDAALAARLIQVANSPLYRGRSAITDLQQAVARLGTKLVRTLVLSLVMQQIFQPTTDVLDTRLRRLWEHSVQVAAISRVLAQPFKHLQPDQAMLGGLVHDIGALPILLRSEDSTQLQDEALLDRVVARLHGQVGKIILEAWGFPAALVQVAAEHEDLARAPGTAPDYVDVVLVANLQSYIGTSHPHARRDWSAIPAFSRLGLRPEVNVVELDGSGACIQEVQQMFGHAGSGGDQGP